MNARVSDDGMTVPGGTRALPRSRRHTGTDRLGLRIGGGGEEGKDLQGTFREVTARDGRWWWSREHGPALVPRQV